MRVIRGIFWCATIVLAVLVVGGFALSTQDLRFAAPYLEKTLTERFGSAFTIKGPIRAALIPEGVRLSLSDVAIENVEWGLEPSAGRAGRIVVDAKLRPLFEGRLDLARLRMRDATLYVERNDDGSVNWLTLASERDRVSGIQQVDLTNIDVQFYDLSKSGLTRLGLRKLIVEPVEDGVTYRGRMQVAGQPIAFSGKTDRLSAWAHGAPARSHNSVSLGGYRLAVDGDLSDPRERRSELQISGTTPEGGLLPALFGLPEGGHPIKARLAIGSSGVVFDDLVLGEGETGPYGTISLDWKPFERPLIDAYLHAVSAQVGGRQFADTSWSAHLTETAKRIARIARNWDARVELEIAELDLFGARLDDFQLHLKAFDGRIADSRMETLVAGGYAEIPFQVWFEPTLSVAAQPRAKNLRLERLTSDNDEAMPFGGLLSMAADLRGEGETPLDLLASMEGQTNMLLGDGVIVPSALADLGTNAWSEIWQLFSYGRWNRDPVTEVMALSCVVSRFDFTDGLATANGFLVETHAAATTGDGFVDLKDGRIDFRLSPRPKDPAQLAEATDLRVAGQLARPTLTPQKEGPSDRRGAGGVGTLVLSGGAQSLLPLMDITHENENVCVRQISGSVSEADSLATSSQTGGGG